MQAHRYTHPHGLASTKAGPLLKQQIPIRTYAQWDEAKPGFLEVDLVTHCGGRLQGGCLYTITLTDVATGWTECLPLLNRGREAVLAALQRARTRFPFPILGLDTDNGAEFINEEVAAYCVREQITFTRGRPYEKRDQSFVEQKNGVVVRQVVGHGRLVGECASRQLDELYRALHWYVNCFQPSMKLVSKQVEGRKIQRIYDAAKTPLQRVLLSGVVSPSQQQELRAIAKALDPLRLFQQVEQLQQVLLRSADASMSLTQRAPALVRFSVEACLTGASSLAETVPELLTSSPESDVAQHDVDGLLDWPRSTRDPFAGMWEQICLWLIANPARSGQELFGEVQRLAPGRYRPTQLNTLQRGVRKIRARLLARKKEVWPAEVIQGIISSSRGASQQQEEHTREQPVGAVPQPLSASESERGDPLEVAAAHRESRLGDASSQDCSPSRPQAKGTKPLPARRTPISIDQAIQCYLQEQQNAKRSPNTLEWHRTSLATFRQYAREECHLTWLSQLTEQEVQGWLAFLRTTPSATGVLRAESTVTTYARSLRAFCHWLVQRGSLACSPFVIKNLHNGDKKSIRVLEPEIWERLLQACCPVGGHVSLVDLAVARNCAILWVLRDTGLRVSELCDLRVEGVDREHRLLQVRGRGPTRQIALSPEGWGNVLSYLDDHHPQAARIAKGKVEETSLFLSERYEPLTPNAITLLFGRLRERAGITGPHMTPLLLRDTFAVRYLQAGGDLEALSALLGLKNVGTAKRYLHASQWRIKELSRE